MVALIVAAGCTTPQDRADREERYFNTLASKCAGFGFRPGTDAFAGCVQNQHMCEQRKSRAQTEYLRNLNAMNQRRGTGFIQNSNDAFARTDMSGLCH